jgi:hypothetical protein
VEVFLVRSEWDRPHLSVPANSLWHATSHSDLLGTDSLSPPAIIFRGLALLFPQFQAPGRAELLQLHRVQVDQSGSRRRPYGDVTLKKALKELKEHGFYGIQMVSSGRQSRASGSKVELAYARSFSNEPRDHAALLDALTPSQIRNHDAAGKDLWRRWLMTGRIGVGNVISLDAHRRKTA